jgi:hypothetical protein
MSDVTDRITFVRMGVAPAGLEWKFRRAVARVGVVDEVMADHATNWCGRPYRRTEVLPACSTAEQPRVTWSIDGDIIAEFIPEERGPDQLIVRDVSVLDVLRRRLRSRHVTIEYPTWPHS